MRKVRLVPDARHEFLKEVTYTRTYPVVSVGVSELLPRPRLRGRVSHRGQGNLESPKPEKFWSKDFRLRLCTWQPNPRWLSWRTVTCLVNQIIGLVGSQMRANWFLSIGPPTAANTSAILCRRPRRCCPILANVEARNHRILVTAIRKTDRAYILKPLHRQQNGFKNGTEILQVSNSMDLFFQSLTSETLRPEKTAFTAPQF